MNGAQASFLLDTAMLLREDVWTRVTARSPQELKPWPVLKLVSVGGTPLNIHGSACVKLELEGEKFSTEVVIVSPLPSEAILGLDFLQEQQAMIDLASKKLRLRDRGCDLPLRDLTPLRVRSEQPVLAVRTVEVPPCSMLEIEASIETPVEGVWLVQEAVDKRPEALACALVQPRANSVPVRLLNPWTEPVTVYAGTTLATLESVDFPAGAVNAVSGDAMVTAEADVEK